MHVRSVAIAAALMLVVPLGGAWASSSDQSERETARALRRCAPATYEAALRCLDTSLPADVQARLSAPDGTIEAHFGLGMWIRNNWGLWRGSALSRSMTALGFEHPDDMSAAILEGFAARERGEAFDVTTKAAEYRAEAARIRDQAAREGRAASFSCLLPIRSSEEQIAAALRACADRLAEGNQD